MQPIHDIILALGANHKPKTQLKKAQKLLDSLLEEAVFTPCIMTEPIGIRGRKFANCLCKARTSLAEEQLLPVLKEVEGRCGDTRGERHEGRIWMDIDLLLYDHTRRHEPDWQRSYVRTLLQQLGISSDTGHEAAG
ncbi:MAG: 2-amino-4-hydroxy-6-hydroxymethyldihydropteridine diphosphokinase [Prevotella sp.]|nr:2-amino-4-hydroxy-6-hydroxymethyldihydropteridine diphosphokinase [Prevotella sp.]